MEELPEIQFNRSPEVPAQPGLIPGTAPEWLPEQQAAPGIPDTSPEAASKSIEPLSYDLDISPGMRATVEVEQMAETDFDRHEILDETEPEGHSKNGMIPVSQILAERSAQYTPEQGKDSGRSQIGARIGSARQFLRLPMYQRALSSGVKLGFVIAVITAFVFIIISR